MKLFQCSLLDCVDSIIDRIFYGRLIIIHFNAFLANSGKKLKILPSQYLLLNQNCVSLISCRYRSQKTDTVNALREPNLVYFRGRFSSLR